MKDKIIGFFQSFFLPSLVFGTILFALYRFLSPDTWQAFYPNFLSTMFGAMVGVPIAFWINRQVQASDEKVQRDRIIPKLREELFVNLRHLSSWQKSGRKGFFTGAYRYFD